MIRLGWIVKNGVKIVTSEYMRIYQPRTDTNTCCEKCQNCAGGCAWLRDFQPIPGWKTRNTVNRDRTDGIKILYCPEFLEGDPLDEQESNIDGIIALFSRICEMAAIDYKEAIKIDCRTEMERCENFLGDYAPPLKRRILAELEGEANAKNK